MFFFIILCKKDENKSKLCIDNPIFTFVVEILHKQDNIIANYYISILTNIEIYLFRNRNGFLLKMWINFCRLNNIFLYIQNLHFISVEYADYLFRNC